MFSFVQSARSHSEQFFTEEAVTAERQRLFVIIIVS